MNTFKTITGDKSVSNNAKVAGVVVSLNTAIKTHRYY